MMHCKVVVISNAPKLVYVARKSEFIDGEIVFGVQLKAMKEASVCA